jgi:hypothetical protein
LELTVTPAPLRDLPPPTRVVAAAFLLTAAAGYGAALAQVHFQAAPPGTLLPGPADLDATYAGGGPPMSPVERLIEAESGPLNGNGSMRPAFTTRSRDWEALTRGAPAGAVRRLEAEREGERLALLSWVRAGAPRAAYDADDYQLGAEFADRPITPGLLNPGPAGHRRVRLRTLLAWRCVDCHGPAGRFDRARLVPLDSYERLRAVCAAPADRRMPLPRLAQTTHVHLLGFAVLYGATGGLFSLTGYPRAVRLVLGPLPLAAQGLDIACWWLARAVPAAAAVIPVAAGLAGIGLAVHIGGGLWDLFGRRGRAVLVALAVAVLAAGVAAKVTVVDPYLADEGSAGRVHE